MTVSATCLDAALAYAEHGWPVFASYSPCDCTLLSGTHCDCHVAECDRVGKHPHFNKRTLPNGLLSASVDPKVIRGWWATWPQANVGVVAGTRSGFVALDEDAGKGGAESLAELEHEYGVLPRTVLSRTGGGGHHFLFANPPREVRNKQGILPGIDVRGEGGYIIAPPSLHKSGGHYAWNIAPDDAAPAAMPEWLLGVLRGETNGTVHTAAFTAAGALGERIVRGARNGTLASLAGSMRRRGMSVEAIEAALLVENSRCVDANGNPDPLPVGEVRKIAWSVGRYAPDDSPTIVKNAAEFILPPLKREVAAEKELGGGARIVEAVFHTAREIAERTEEAVEWVAIPWLARGAVTEIDGKIKAAGKTTWVTYMIRAILDGQPFMERPTRKAPVVLLTEQGERSFREALRRAELTERDDLYIFYWHENRAIPWASFVNLVIQHCLAVGAETLVVDTLGQFAGLKGDDENSGGAALEAVAPLQAAASDHNLAVCFLRHERKSGGDVGDSGRGSSAFGGAVDIVLRLRRGEGNSRPTLRIIDAMSRFDETPAALTVDLTSAGYVALGEESAVARGEAKRALLDILPTEAARAKKLEDVLAMTPSTRRSVAQDALRDLLTTCHVARLGGGKKGDPYLYYQIHSAARGGVAAERIFQDETLSSEEEGAAADSFSAATSLLRGGRMNSHRCSECGEWLEGSEKYCSGCLRQQKEWGES